MKCRRRSQHTGRNREPSPLLCRHTKVTPVVTGPGVTQAQINQHHRHTAREVNSRD